MCLVSSRPCCHSNSSTVTITVEEGCTHTHTHTRKLTHLSVHVSRQQQTVLPRQFQSSHRRGGGGRGGRGDAGVTEGVRCRRGGEGGGGKQELGLLTEHIPRAHVAVFVACVHVVCASVCVRVCVCGCVHGDGCSAHENERLVVVCAGRGTVILSCCAIFSKHTTASQASHSHFSYRGSNQTRARSLSLSAGSCV